MKRISTTTFLYTLFYHSARQTKEYPPSSHIYEVRIKDRKYLIKNLQISRELIIILNGLALR